MAPSITIAGRAVGRSHPPYIICELSANHNGRVERALDLIEAAAATGADAVKIQTYTPDTLTIAHDAPEFRIRGGLWDGYTLYDLYRETHTPYEWHPALVQRAKRLGITIFSTPFDEGAVNFLSDPLTSAYKIALFEIVDLHPIECGAAKKADDRFDRDGEQGRDFRGGGDGVRRRCRRACSVALRVIVPGPIEQANLRTITDLADHFGVVVGLSDHTPGTACAVAAVAVGASVIEKHFTLRRADGGPDAAFSLEPDEFKRLVEDCRAAWSSLGHAGYERSAAERENLMFRRSLYVVKDVAAGEELTSRNIQSIRPGYGLAPKHLSKILGQRAAHALKRGDPLRWEDIAGVSE